MQLASSLVSPQCLKRKCQKHCRTGHVRHHPRKRLWRLPHRPYDVSGITDIHHQKTYQSAHQPFFAGSTDPHGSNIIQSKRSSGSSSFALVATIAKGHAAHAAWPRACSTTTRPATACCLRPSDGFEHPWQFRELRLAGVSRSRESARGGRTPGND